jgi:predicted dehydrogenase
LTLKIIPAAGARSAVPKSWLLPIVNFYALEILMNRLKTAIIGTGFMSWVHLDALRRIGVNVTGMLGSSAAKSHAAAGKYGLNRTYLSVEEILEDSEVDCVHVCTPNQSHFELVSRSLKAGKHVLCEKPLAMDSRQSAELVKLANQFSQQATAVNYNIRFYPLCSEVRCRIQDGRQGEILHVNGSYVQDWLLKSTDYNWRVLADQGGALRAVADIGTHWLDLITWMTGLRISAVCADLRTVHPVRNRPEGEVTTFAAADEFDVSARKSVEISTDDYGAILLQFENGARGSLHVSQVNAGRKNCLRFEVAGSESACAWNSEVPNELWLGYRDRSNETLVRDPALLSSAAAIHAAYPGGHNEGYADSFRACFAAFYTAIQQQDFSGQTYPTFADGDREIRICEAILNSHQSRSWVEVS